MSATARIALPVMVSVRNRNSSAIAIAAMIDVLDLLRPDMQEAERTSRAAAGSHSRAGCPPKKKRIVLSIIRLTAIEAIASVSALWPRSGRSATWSLAMPTAPAPMNAPKIAIQAGRPSQTLSM